MDVLPAGLNNGSGPGDFRGEYGKSKKHISVSSNSMSAISDSENSPPLRKKMASTSKIARECAYDIICHITKKKTRKLKPANTKYAVTLRRTVDEILVKHEIFFSSSMRRLEVNEESACATIDNVANEMLVDRQFNWGRLTALYAFCGKIAKHCVDNSDVNQDNLVERIADYTADYIADGLSERIQENGGWDAFVDRFPAPDATENVIWRGLLCTMVGLGALATMVVAR